MLRAPYESLPAWCQAMSLVVRAHRLAGRLPESERSGLGAALKKATTTAASRIADGYGRLNEEEAVAVYEVALGALREADTTTLIAHRLGYLRAGHVNAMRKHLAAVTHAIELLCDEAEETGGETIQASSAA